MSLKKPLIVWTSRNPNKADEHKKKEQNGNIKIEAAKETIEIIPESEFKKGRSKLQLLLVTILSAVVLGVVIGAVMLKLLTVFEADEASVAVSGHVNGAAGQKSEVLTAYVLQGGVFAKKKNAEEWLAKYNKAGVPATLWKQDESYYLFAGVATAESQAAEQAAEMKQKKLDIYVKEWTAPIANGFLTEKEKKWIGEFSTIWSTTLQQSVENKKISEADWEKLVKSAPAESVACQNLAKSINGNINKLKKNDSKTARQALLNIWKSGSSS